MHNLKQNTESKAIKMVVWKPNHLSNHTQDISMTCYKGMLLSKLIRVYKIYLAYNLYNIKINCLGTKQRHKEWWQ